MNTTQQLAAVDHASIWIVIPVRSYRGRVTTSKTGACIEADIRAGRSYVIREEADRSIIGLIQDQLAENAERMKAWEAEMQAAVTDGEGSVDTIPSLSGPVLDSDKFLVMNVASFEKASGEKINIPQVAALVSS